MNTNETQIMNNPTFNVELGAKPNGNGEHAVHVRATINRQNKRFTVEGVRVAPEHFENEGYKHKQNRQRIKPAHPLAETLNKLIRVKLLEVETMVLASGAQSIDELNRHVNGETAQAERAPEPAPASAETPTLVAALMDAFNASEKAGKPQTANVFRTVANSVTRLIGDIALDDIKRETLDDYANALTCEGKRVNTVHKHMRTLRRSINRYIHDLKRWDGKNPFNRYGYKLKSERTAKTKLTRNEVAKLEAAVHRIKSYDLARDLFLFMFYTCGTRIGDVLTLQPNQVRDGVLCYQMDKTGDPHEVPLNDEAQAILAKWQSAGPFVFPVLKADYFSMNERQKKQRINSATVYVNKFLQLVCTAEGITKRVSCHVARHTWAYIAHERGASLEDIRKALGHKSILTTQTYVSDLSRKVNRSVIDLVTGSTQTVRMDSAA